MPGPAERAGPDERAVGEVAHHRDGERRAEQHEGQRPGGAGRGGDLCGEDADGHEEDRIGGQDAAQDGGPGGRQLFDDQPEEGHQAQHQGGEPRGDHGDRRRGEPTDGGAAQQLRPTGVFLGAGVADGQQDPDHGIDERAGRGQGPRLQAAHGGLEDRPAQRQLGRVGHRRGGEGGQRLRGGVTDPYARHQSDGEQGHDGHPGGQQDPVPAQDEPQHRAEPDPSITGHRTASDS
ncbi:hypothetical protein SDC9_140298 [bioreactor metagenome]|uniref:Uncharacterized protein n=1 Tax=bioreactor metagenome TaxID=1076179 RepID=A0A645DXV2_9ZZZZ